eukprot:5098214-Ditylum_brightwellii.AAC.1
MFGIMPPVLTGVHYVKARGGQTLLKAFWDVGANEKHWAFYFVATAYCCAGGCHGFFCELAKLGTYIFNIICQWVVCAGGEEGGIIALWGLAGEHCIWIELHFAIGGAVLLTANPPFCTIQALSGA